MIAKTTDVDRAARRVLDPIVSMALDGYNAFFFSGVVRRPTREEFEDYMGMKQRFDADFRKPFILKPQTFVSANIVDQYGKATS